jgi:hypothetical protein
MTSIPLAEPLKPNKLRFALFKPNSPEKVTVGISLKKDFNKIADFNLALKKALDTQYEEVKKSNDGKIQEQYCPRTQCEMTLHREPGYSRPIR